MGYVIAICWTALLSVMLVLHLTEEEYSVGYNTIQMIEECQKTLPRNVECGIVAIPETEMEE